MVFVGVLPAQTPAQESGSETVTLEMIMQEIRDLKKQQQSLRHTHNRLAKAIDDIMWRHEVGDIAKITKVRLTGPPLRNQPNPTAQGAGNPLIIRAYTFLPRNRKPQEKLPLVVLVHGGVHGNHNTGAANVVRELLMQGYAIVAPEYRGSTGYGRGFYQAIDYGGLEIEDTFSARNFMLESFDFIDSKRVGIIGWSHGGLHALMNVFEHPEAFLGALVLSLWVPVVLLRAVRRRAYRVREGRNLPSGRIHM